MGLEPSLIFGKVMHKRLFPKVNGFTYGIYYLAFRLQDLARMKLSGPVTVNRFGLMSFYDRDHGPRDGTNLDLWIRNILTDRNLNHIDGDIVLVCMPRILGYVFNPVSFWLCYDRHHDLRAVLCEVNNTFGERHSYLCCPADRGIIAADQWLEADKVFHVSPFLKREGHYKFRFDINDQRIGIAIDYFDAAGQKQLLTFLNGKTTPISWSSWLRAFFGYPLVTFRAIWLIHYQAVKLLLKGQTYVPKPVQKADRLTETGNVTKN